MPVSIGNSSGAKGTVEKKAPADPKKRPRKNAPAVEAKEDPAKEQENTETGSVKKEKETKAPAEKKAAEKLDVKVNPAQKEAADGLLSACINAEQASLSVWQATGAFILADKRIKIQADKDSMADLFFAALDAAHDPALIPAKGEDQKGNEIDLRHADGKVKWRSWATTSRMVQNTSDIFKGLVLLGAAVVFPKAGMLSRRKLLAAIEAKELELSGPTEPEEGGEGDDGDKEKEAPIDTIKRSLILVDRKIDELDASQYKEVYDLMDSVFAKLEGLISAQEAQESK